MRPHLLPLAMLVAWAACVACGGGGTPEGGGPTAPTTGPTGPTATTAAATPGLSLAWSPDSRKVDKVGGTDGALSPDGTKDVVCIADVEGPATALFIAAVTSKGEPTGDFQADTLVGGQALPIELSLAGAAGKESAGLVAFEGDKLLNAPDGSLRALSPGPHKLTIYMNDHAAIKDGIRLFVQRADGSLAKSTILR
jgi:hypothetical protein